jgi:hypothetical protein
MPGEFLNKRVHLSITILSILILQCKYAVIPVSKFEY